jgi:hypothetical protein
LVIKGAPPGTQVLLDGKAIGTVQPDGTLSQPNLSPGDHTIELHRDQFRPKRISKHFNAGETVQLGGSDVALERAGGTLRLTVAPPDSRITMALARSLIPR